MKLLWLPLEKNISFPVVCFASSVTIFKTFCDLSRLCAVEPTTQQRIYCVYVGFVKISFFLVNFLFIFPINRKETWHFTQGSDYIEMLLKISNSKQLTKYVCLILQLKDYMNFSNSFFALCFSVRVAQLSIWPCGDFSSGFALHSSRAQFIYIG